MSGYNTYFAAFTGLNPGTAATTVIAELVCTGTQEIQLLRVGISGTEATATAVNDVLIIKESTNSTLGTKTGVLGLPFSTLNTTPATATLNGYTVTPTAGTLVGVMASFKATFPLIGLVVIPPVFVIDFVSLQVNGLAQLPALNAANEAFAITLNAATPANAPSLDIYMWWQEVPLLT
jgi:hypothetical protein